MGGLPELLMVNTGDEALSGLDEDAADYTAKRTGGKTDCGEDPGDDRPGIRLSLSGG